jgi:hypothetical protein
MIPSNVRLGDFGLTQISGEVYAEREFLIQQAHVAK